MEYLIYFSEGRIECADVDDMTEYANNLLNSGYKDIRLVIKEEYNMIEFSELKEMSLNEIFKLSDEYKHKAIYLLIEQIAEDRVFDAITHFKTDEEAKKFKDYISK